MAHEVVSRRRESCNRLAIGCELMIRSAHHGASNIMEPEHANQTPSYHFPRIAARGDLGDGPGGLDDF
jgi:hypothetical protein